MPRSKKKEPTWEELLNSLVAIEPASTDTYYTQAREKIRAYVKDLEGKVEELEHELEQAYRDIGDLEMQIPSY